MTHTLKLTLAQINPIVGGLDYNCGKIRDTWAISGADIVVFPEMIVCGYPPEDLVLKPSFIDDIHAAVEALVKDSKNYSAAALIGCPWRIDGAVYNVVHLIQGGEILYTQAKYHLPNYGVFDEHRVFKAGPLPAPFEFKGIKLGIMICEDMWYTDVAAHLKDQGAKMLIVPNGSPFETTKDTTREDYARARVNETGLPLVYVNQVGGQDELVFDGASFVLDQAGEKLFQGAEFAEDRYELTLSGGPEWSAKGAESIPGFSDEEELYQALVLGLRDYINKNGFPGVILGLSGGIDSALSAAIAADALGPENVHCVMMPSQFTSQDSLDDAAACADALGCPYDIINIKDAMTAFEGTIPALKGVAHENMQSRSRGLILMALSNARGPMVLSTGNKSEMAVGYATLYGDMNGGFNALKDLYKMQVYALSAWRNAHKPKGGLGPEGAVIPERIITKAPSAELREDQTDQDSLPPYEDLDDILQCLIEHEMDIEEICKRGHGQDTVKRVWTMLDRAEYKRRQAPPGIKITSRAFGRDRRYPITNHYTKQVKD